MSSSGAYVGTIVSMPLSGWLCDSKYGPDWMAGWPSVFYLCGALGVFWFVLWICLVHSDPRTHPRMSAAELQYIMISAEILYRTNVKYEIKVPATVSVTVYLLPY